MRDRIVRIVAASGVAMAFAATASYADVSDTIFRIDVTVHDPAGDRSDSYVYVQGQDQYGAFDGNGNYNWFLNGGSSQALLGGEVILTHAAVTLIADPVVTLDFGVQNTTGFDTTISVSSALLSFATINNAEANISASVGVNDFNFDGSATLTPIAGKGYTAFYNGAAPGSGTEFSSLFAAAINAPAFGSTNLTQDFPGAGVFGPIAGGVSNASSSFAFMLSAGDLANGSSTYTIIPAPASLGLLGLGGLVASRRRRR